MKLKYVAITGTDDGVKVEDLNAVAREYPFVEWAAVYAQTGGRKAFTI